MSTHETHVPTTTNPQAPKNPPQKPVDGDADGKVGDGTQTERSAPDKSNL